MENTREEKKILKRGTGTVGTMALYKIFKKYISYPSFKAVLSGKSKFSELQFENINALLFSTNEEAQVFTNIKDAIKFLNAQGFNEYSWEQFEKFGVWSLREATEEKKTKKKEEEPPVEYVSYLNTDTHIYEQGYNKKANKVYFIAWNKEEKSWEIVNDFVIDGITYKPIRGEELAKQAVILPYKPVEYENDEELEQTILTHIDKWLDVSEEYRQLAYYNILLSWVYQRFNTLSYTRALGDTGTGKSRFLFTLGHLHYKPMMVAGALTSAVIFRIINKWKGTLLIDEGDQKDSDETNSFIKIMNCGYERGMVVSRCDKNDPNKLDFFDVFCPKVLTTRKRFEDKATEARCMTTIMTQTFRTDIKENFTVDYEESVEKIRGMLLLWRFKNFDNIDPEAGFKIDLNDYEPRLRQVNRAFVSLFANNDAAVTRFKTYLTKYQETIIDERANSFDGTIVNCFAEMVANNWENITFGDIVTFVSDKNIQFQYPLTAKGVGKCLRSQGIETVTKKVETRARKVILMRKEILTNIFSRYVVDDILRTKLGTMGYLVTQVTQLPKTLNNFANVENEGKTDTDVEIIDLAHCHSNDGNLGNSVTLRKRVFEYLVINDNPYIGDVEEALSLKNGDVNGLIRDGDVVEMPAGRLRKL